MLKESGHIILCSTAVRLYKVIHKSWYIWHSPVPGNIFRWDFHFLRLILMALNFHGNWFFFKIPKDCFYSDNVYLSKFKFQHLGVILGAHRTPKIGCFSKIYEIALLLSSNKATAMVFIWGERRYPAVRYWVMSKIVLGVFLKQSCANVQTETSIFKYANWPRLQIKRTGLSSWSIQLVRPACLSSKVHVLKSARVAKCKK